MLQHPRSIFTIKILNITIFMNKICENEGDFRPNELRR